MYYTYRWIKTNFVIICFSCASYVQYGTMLTSLHFIGSNIMTMVATRIDVETNKAFELLAQMQHKTKSQLLQELIQKYLQTKNINIYKKAAQNIAAHEKSHPNEYADIYATQQDWD